MDLRNGVCRNLIEGNGMLFCPLHPKRVGKDLRTGHCDINYFCRTAKEYFTGLFERGITPLRLVSDEDGPAPERGIDPFERDLPAPAEEKGNAASAGIPRQRSIR